MKPTVCVDLDGVLAAYDGWVGYTEFGKPIPGAREFMEELESFSHVLIHTNRCDPESAGVVNIRGLKRNVERYLDRSQIPFAEIWTGHGKPRAVGYVDDKAVICRPQEEGAIAFAKVLEHLKVVCQRKEKSM